MVNRRSPYRHRVRAHKRLGRPVKSFLRGKGAPRQPRKYRHVDGWRRRVVVRKPPIVKRPPKVVVREPPLPPPTEAAKRIRRLSDRLDVHRINLGSTELKVKQARTFDAKTRYYKEYLGHAELFNETLTEINRLKFKDKPVPLPSRPRKPIPLQEMQKRWKIKPGWVRGLKAGDRRAPKAAKIIGEYDSLWARMERKYEQEERMTPAERRKSVRDRIDITKEAIEVSGKYNELTGTPLSAYGFKLFPKHVIVPGEITLKAMFTKEQLSEYKKYKRELKKKR